MAQVKNTSYYSKKIGELAEGCKYCVKGEKLVLFVTGICPRECYFCPLADEKYQKDVIYANERKINSKKDISPIIEEARLCEAKGAGITGGDPLARLDRTTSYIRSLKQEFQKNQKNKKRFHIHLYTSLDLVSNDSLRKLYMAGLDEIRFHPSLEDSSQWNKIDLALKYNWRLGVEVPVIPGKEIQLKRLIESISGKVHFLNLNELEIADNKTNKLSEMGFSTKNELSYAIKGSGELAKKILDYISENNIRLNVHYCTAKLKDKVQLARRIKKRAKNVRQRFDTLTEEGLLVRGAIYPKNLEPGFGYQKKIKKSRNEKSIRSLQDSARKLRKDFRIKENMLIADEKKLRMLTSVKIAKSLSKKIKNRCAVVTEYPTEDSFEVDIEFLN